jgi:hypothetical protein
MDHRTEGVERGAPEAPNDDMTDEAAGRTRKIRAEIDRTREDMSETIDAIQDKLRPGNIVAEASDRVRNATTERMKQMTGEGSRDKLIPAALIGIGTAWLLWNRGHDSSRNERWRSARTWSGEEGGRGYFGAVGTGGAMAESTRYEGQSVQSLAGRASERASELGGEARAKVQQSTRRARNQLSRMLDENPLMVGAAAVVIGAAVGMALPETERENEWLGEARENVVDRAQDMARTAAERVKEKAGEAARTIGGIDQS